MWPRERRRYLEALGVRTYARPEAGSGAAVAAPAAQTSASAPARVEVPPPALHRAPAAQPSPPPAPPAPEPAPAVAAEPVPAFDTLDAARACVAECTRCALHGTRTRTVFGVGAAGAPLLVIGEGPGAEEDRRGEPFVGRAGQLLDAMLAAIGHDRARNVYIANVVKCRPPNNRDPAPDEVEACRPFLDAQIRLLQPRLILAVGRVAAQRLLGSDQPLARLRGRLHTYGDEAVPVWVSYHPAYLLRAPREKAKAWDDLKRVHAMLAETAGGAGG